MEHSLTNTTPIISTGSVEPEETISSDHACKVILYYEIPDTRYVTEESLIGAIRETMEYLFHFFAGYVFGM